MPKYFDAISSPGGKRDFAVDLTGALESAETLVSADVTSESDTVLGITLDGPNPNEIVQDGVTIAANKGVIFSIETLVVANNKGIKINIDYVGNSGSADGYQVLLPVVPVLEG